MVLVFPFQQEFVEVELSVDVRRVHGEGWEVGARPDALGRQVTQRGQPVRPGLARSAESNDFGD